MLMLFLNKLLNSNKRKTLCDICIDKYKTCKEEHCLIKLLNLG